jgi:hypothetical protein
MASGGMYTCRKVAGRGTPARLVYSFITTHSVASMDLPCASVHHNSRLQFQQSSQLLVLRQTRHRRLFHLIRSVDKP